MMKWLEYQIKSFLYYLLFKKKYPLPMLEASVEEVKVFLTKPDEIRRQELQDKFKDLQGWKGDEEFRIAEKERDAELIKAKACGQLKALLENTSLLALNNEQLSSLLLEAQAFVAELEAEARRRE